MRAGLERGVCSTARFVDRLFGGDREFAEYDDEASGRASVTLGWNEQDHVEVDTRFRASVNLPQINERFNATIGKASSDEYVADEIGVFNPAVGAFSDDDPAEWFAGVGYRAHRDAGQPIRPRCRREARVAAQSVRERALPALHLSRRRMCCSRCARRSSSRTTRDSA